MGYYCQVEISFCDGIKWKGDACIEHNTLQLLIESSFPLDRDQPTHEVIVPEDVTPEFRERWSVAFRPWAEWHLLNDR